MKKILNLLLVLFPLLIIGQVTENFVKSTTYKQASLSSIANPTPAQAKVDVTYFDGLGRPIQQVAYGQSHSGKDIVTPIEYDGFGRQVKEYLPYVPTTAASLDYKPTALTDVLSYTGYAGQNPFSEKAFEASPLNRVIKQAAPGYDWRLNSGREIKMEYQTNVAFEVRLFTFSLSFADNTYTPNALAFSTSNAGYYAPGELYKTITYDENSAATPLEANGATVEFKNKEGQVVLKRTYGTVGLGTTLEKHDTYYIYDDYGNLTFVLPPKIDATFAAVTTINSQLNDLAYQYKYDYRNRLVEKKLPGKQWEFIVYDKLDRPVATGPSNSPFTDTAQGAVGWLITKYDVFSRPVYTGWEQVTSINSTARITKQNTENSKAVLNETKQTSGTIDGISVYYSNLVAPTAFKLLTVNYYDNYTFPSAAPIPTAVETEPVLTTAQVKSLATGSWTRILAAAGATNGETATTFYDAKERPIRTYATNFLGGYTYTDTKVDFVGVPQYSITYHKRTGGATELKTREAFTYSAQGRLLTQTHQINDGAIELIASNQYDELGQLIIKNVGNTVSLPLQKVNFAYNIRGWMTEINKTAALTQNGDPKDLFAFKINYNTTSTSINGVTALYNGNIAETHWNTADVTRSYGYKYDHLNRLRDAVFQKAAVTTNAYNETLSYDRNGNIMNLVRNGTSETATAIDNLVYSYGPANSTNQLTKVADTSNNTVGFIDSALNNVDDYTYDLNGNMISDNNKGITAITYNHLNLPTKITFAANKNIAYFYNATGQKVQKVVNDNGGITTTDYLGGYQYLNTALQFFPTADGYVEPVAPSSYNYIYQYKDHLGNVRISYRNTGTSTSPSLQIQEENNYYPFGLKQTGYGAPSISSNNKYKYQGQEWQDELGLNIYFFKFRMSDPSIGRFLQIDPLSPSYTHISPYAFAENNVTSGTDLEGLELSFNLQGDRATAQSGPRVTGGVNGNYTLQELKSHMAQQQSEYNRDMGMLMAGDPRNLPKSNISLPSWHIDVAKHNDPSMMMANGALIGAEIMATDIAVGRIFQGIGALRKGKSIWGMNALERGREAESRLGGNLGWNFPTIDKLSDGVATSIKSLDLTAESYQKGNSVFNTLKGYINKLADFTGATWGGATVRQGEQFTSKALEIAVQTGKGSEAQWKQIGQAINYALEKDISVTIKFIN